MPVETPKIFISHSWDNKPLVRRLDAELKAAGAEVWVDHASVRGGDNLPKEISAALAWCNTVVLVWSQSAAQSHWVELEWTNAIALRKLVIPCRLDKTALPMLLANLVCIDFIEIEKGITQLCEAVQLGQKPVTNTPTSNTERVARFLRFEWAGDLPAIWNVPHLRNRNFTGRSQLLADLRQALTAEKSAALTQTQAIHGLGGVGKTQLALEYVYPHAADYDLVWWIRAEDTVTLATDYVNLAARLELPMPKPWEILEDAATLATNYASHAVSLKSSRRKRRGFMKDKSFDDRSEPNFEKLDRKRLRQLEKEEKDQTLLIEAVRSWLEQHSRWLLIFDNAQEMEDLRPYLPRGATGHILITSQNPNWRGVANALKINVMEPQEAVDFLHKSTGQKDPRAAQDLAAALGYLPLALDQAGAYSEAAKKSLADYLQLFQQHHLKILEAGQPSADYRRTTATTWELAFQQIKEQSPASVELLNLCAFLAPDDIPRDLLQEGIKKTTEFHALTLADSLTFDEAVITLRSFSLIEAKSDALSVHRLVQAVVCDRLTENEKKTWAETTVQIINGIFPEKSFDDKLRRRCEVLLPHAQAAIEHADALQVDFENTAHYLLNQVGAHLIERNAYAEAKPLCRRALAIREKLLGPEHLEVATSVDNLAKLFHGQKKYSDAELLYRRAMTIREKQLGPEHLEVAASLDSLARLFYDQDKYSEAEPLYRRALTIRDKLLGPEHLDVATSLDNLAKLFRGQKKYSDAELLYRRALTIREKLLGPEHLDVVENLNDLAFLMHLIHKDSEAEALYLRALGIREKQLGAGHLYVAMSLDALARFFSYQHKYSKAERFYRRALAIEEKKKDHENWFVARLLRDLARLFHDQKKYSEAEALYRRALAIKEKQFGPEDGSVVLPLSDLASLFHDQKKYSEAEALYRRAQAIEEKQLEPEYWFVVWLLRDLARLFHDQKEYSEAEPLYRRALAITEKRLKPDDWIAESCLEGLVRLLHDQKKYSEVELLYQQALAIWEKQLGPEHLDVAERLDNLADLFYNQKRYAEAEPLYRRVLTIREKLLEPKHWEIATSLQNLADTLCFKGKYAEAEKLMQRAQEIRTYQYPYIAKISNIYIKFKRFWYVEKNLNFLTKGRFLFSGIHFLAFIVLLEFIVDYRFHVHLKEISLCIIPLSFVGILIENIGDWKHIGKILLGVKYFAYIRYRGIGYILIRWYWLAAIIAVVVITLLHQDETPLLQAQALLYYKLDKVAEAEQLCRRILEIQESKLEKDYPAVVESLENFADLLYYGMDKAAEAESFYRRVLEIRESKLEKDHLDIATSLNDLANTLSSQSKYAEAEPLYRRALAIREKKLNKDDPDVVVSLEKFADLLYYKLYKAAEAETLYRRVLEIRESKLEKDHLDISVSLNDLANTLSSQSKYAEAEPLYRRALAIAKKKLGPEHLTVATYLTNLAKLFYNQEEYAEAEPLYRRALTIREKKLKKDDPDVVVSLENLADLLYYGLDKAAEAKPLYRRILEIRESKLEKDHLDISVSLNDLANTLSSQSKYAEAEPLYRRALAIAEKKLGPEHLRVAMYLNNLANSLRDQGKYAEAEPLYRRALAIAEKQLGLEDSRTKQVRKNLADLLEKMKSKNLSH